MEISNLPKGKKIVLFDGVCNLCDGFVQFMIKRDKKDLFRYLPLQSDLGAAILNHIGIDRSKTDSIILYDPGVAYYYKSNAVIEIAKGLGGIHEAASVFKILPVSTRDAVYDYVAKNRYKWYGKKDSCMMPTPEIKAKFL